MLRYIRMASDKTLALDRSMIPLGSCTMKRNATSAMIPITWPGVPRCTPSPLRRSAPHDQLAGCAELARELGAWRCQATG